MYRNGNNRKNVKMDKGPLLVFVICLLNSLYNNFQLNIRINKMCACQNKIFAQFDVQNNVTIQVKETTNQSDKTTTNEGKLTWRKIRHSVSNAKCYGGFSGTVDSLTSREPNKAENLRYIYILLTDRWVNLISLFKYNTFLCMVGLKMHFCSKLNNFLNKHNYDMFTNTTHMLMVSIKKLIVNTQS